MIDGFTVFALESAEMSLGGSLAAEMALAPSERHSWMEKR